MVDSLVSKPGLSAPTPLDQTSKIRELAEKMEATFLAEMLKNAKFGETPDAFGGGIGEDQFASFLRQAQADEMAKAGGIGLAENLFQALSKTVMERN